MNSEHEAARLLKVWESGTAQNAAVRGLLLLSAARPSEAEESLQELSVGSGDAVLLSLREKLFGRELQCLATCSACGEPVELTFAVDDIRTVHVRDGSSHRVGVHGCSVQFRVPTVADLLAIAGGTDGDAAERQLLTRCILQACDERGSSVRVEDLPPDLIESIEQRMSEVDAQADVDLDVACPACDEHTSAQFDIVGYLWAEIDAWARATLGEIHVLASAYGWTETQILELDAVRRRTYLGLITA